MKARELIELLKEYEDFDAEVKVYFEVSEEELKNRPYPYPTDHYELELIDIGYSEKELLLGVNVDWER